MCIPGTTKVARFDENQGANTVSLSAQDLRYPDEHLPVGAAVGARC